MNSEKLRVKRLVKHYEPLKFEFEFATGGSLQTSYQAPVRCTWYWYMHINVYLKIGAVGDRHM